MNLRGVVFGKFRNISDFAKQLGWNRRKTSNIVNGKQRPSADEMEQMANVLNIHDERTFMSLFFPSMSTK